MKDALHPQATGRDVWARVVHDFAQCGYTTAIIITMFNTSFVAVVTGGVGWATLAWTLALSFSCLIVILSAPVVGTWADQHVAKERQLAGVQLQRGRRSALRAERGLP